MMVANVDLGLGDAVILIDREGNWTYHITPTAVITGVGLVTLAVTAWYWWDWVAHDFPGEYQMIWYVRNRADMALDWIVGLAPDLPQLPWPF